MKWTTLCLLSLLINLVFSLNSWAKITITSVRGASNTILTEAIPQIFGGTGGSCTGDNVDTCDSCTDAGAEEICNTKRVYNALKLRIEFKSDSADSGTALMTKTSDGTAIKSGTSTSAKNGVVAVEETWELISTSLGHSFPTSFNEPITIGIDAAADGSLSGDDSVSITLRLVVPSTSQNSTNLCTDTTNNTEGICDFSIFPGDEKVYVEELKHGDSFPLTGDSSGAKIKALRFFISDDSFDTATPESSIDPADLSVVETTGDPEIPNKIIDGLTNGTRYFFRVSTVDQAENVTNMTSDAAIVASCDATSPAASIDTDCPYSATPDEVLGLLTKDLNCFVATAAYNSSLAPELSVFRQFRYKVLLQRAWGRKFVKWYYHYGPYAARWIDQHEWARMTSRALLWPAWAFAKTSMHFGWKKTVRTLNVLALLSLGLIATLVWRRWRRSRCQLS